MAILGNMHVLYILSITVVCVLCGYQWLKVPKVYGSPLTALGCQLVEGVLYVGKLPVTADGKVSTSVPAIKHMACPYHVCRGTCGARSCLEAAPKVEV